MTQALSRNVVLGLAASLIAVGCGPKIGAGNAEEVAPGSQVAEPDAPKDPRVEAADLARIKGDSSARVWLVMASDFQCPACKYWHDSVSAEIMRDYVDAGKVRFAYLNFPLTQHQNARPAAEAAMCAGAQGRFWEMHDAIFADQDKWSVLPDPTQSLRETAIRVGVDPDAWNACMTEHIMRPMIDGDFSRGNAGGVDQTPYFFIGSQTVGGAIPAAQMRRLLDAAIASAGGASK